jgi:hypothetical protein
MKRRSFRMPASWSFLPLFANAAPWPPADLHQLPPFIFCTSPASSSQENSGLDREPVRSWSATPSASGPDARVATQCLIYHSVVYNVLLRSDAVKEVPTGLFPVRNEAGEQSATSSGVLRSEEKSSRIAPSARVAELADALDLGCVFQRFRQVIVFVLVSVRSFQVNLDESWTPYGHQTPSVFP